MELITTDSPRELTEFMIRGKLAGLNGFMEESLRWYIKGLKLAVELRNKAMKEEFTALIMLSL